MIDLSHIYVTFNKDTPQQVLALKDVSLSIIPGEFVVIVGSNGSGKSTLLNVLAGTIRASAGSVVFDKQDVTAWPEYMRSRLVSRVFQDPMKGTAPELTVLDNLRLAALRTQPKTLRYGTTKAFEQQVKTEVASLQLGLEEKLNQPIGMLSGGQRQALTLLMATMDMSKLLLLDEPVAALDPRTSETIMHLAQRIITTHQLTAVMVTHSLKHASEYGTRIIHMHDGIVLRDITGNEKQQLSPQHILPWFVG